MQKKSINWNEVKVYLESYVGNFYEVMDTKDIVYIGKDFPDEYNGVKIYLYAKRGKCKSKGQCSTGNSRIARNCLRKHYRENTGEKHLRDAANGWY